MYGPLVHAARKFRTTWVKCRQHHRLTAMKVLLPEKVEAPNKESPQLRAALPHLFRGSGSTAASGIV